MALQVQVCRPPPMATTGSSTGGGGGNLIWSITKQPVVCFTGDRTAALVTDRYKRVSLKVMCSSTDTTSAAAAAAVTPAVVVGQVTEVCKDTFWPIVKAAGDKAVVLDMYTQWCGPCKVIAPKVDQLSEKYLDTVFLKLDCNTENRPLVKELGLKVVPTFKIFKDGKIFKEITGAKFDNLVAAIEDARSRLVMFNIVIHMDKKNLVVSKS